MEKVKGARAAKQLRGGLDTTPAAPVDRASLTHEQQLDIQLKALATTACSGQWAIDITAGRTDYPVPGMVLSRCRVLTTGEMVSNNFGEVGVRRWHPALTDRLEDTLDRLGIKQATKYVHPPAIRYDHCTPYREAVVYDPRSIRVDDPPAWVLRCVKLEAWPDGHHVRRKRQTVRTSWPNVFRVKAAGGGWLSHKGKPVLADGGGRLSERDTVQAVPESPEVNAYVQVTE